MSSRSSRRRVQTIRASVQVLGVLAVAGLVAVVATVGLQRSLGAADPATTPPDQGPTFPAQVEEPTVPLPAITGADAGLDYVALGDSFTAGPGIAPRDPHAPELCDRSDSNWPTLLARAVRVRSFVDVSCSGAYSRDIAGDQHLVDGSTVSAQRAVLGPDTDLVTLSIGGNDFSVYGRLFGTCTRVSGADSPRARCREELVDEGIISDVDEVRERLGAAIRDVRAVAPNAAVVVVGYPRMLPDDGRRCAAAPFSVDDIAWMAEVLARLNRSMAGAAADEGVRFVDLHLVEGTDVCADEPWVNGPQSVEGVARAFHPLSHGMRGAADAVLRQLTG